MKFKTPLITLGAGLVVAFVIYALNVTLIRDPADVDDAAPAAAVTATPTEEPSPTPTQVTETPTPAPTTDPPGNGSGPAAPDGTITYAGWVDGDGATLAIVVNNGEALAYICDGATAEAWLAGTMANGLVELTSNSGSLTGTYGNGQVTGDVTAGTTTWHFTIPVAEPPSGAYRSAEELRNQLDASWVVLPDGTQVGVDRTGGTRRPAQPFDLTTGSTTVNGTRVAVEPVEPS